MSINVIVYPDGGNSDQVKAYFSDSTFEILKYNALVGTENPQLNEFLWIKGALEYSKSKNPGRSCIIVKNTSFSNFPSSKIAEICLNAETVEELNMFYLTKWDDLCNLYRTASEFTYWCFSPRGNQCILYTPTGIDIITGTKKMPSGNYFVCKDMWMEECLNIEIAAGNLKATSLFGNLLDYDAVKYGQNNLYFNLLNECQNMRINNNTGASPNIYLYVIGIIVLILLIAWGLYKIGPKEVEPALLSESGFEDEKFQNDYDKGSKRSGIEEQK